jgi:hypothetical protein
MPSDTYALVRTDDGTCEATVADGAGVIGV